MFDGKETLICKVESVVDENNIMVIDNNVRRKVDLFDVRNKDV